MIYIKRQLTLLDREKKWFAFPAAFLGDTLATARMALHSCIRFVYCPVCPAHDLAVILRPRPSSACGRTRDTCGLDSRHERILLRLLRDRFVVTETTYDFPQERKK